MDDLDAAQISRTPASFGARIQIAELDYVVQSKAAMTSLSENYVGLPFWRVGAGLALRTIIQRPQTPAQIPFKTL